MNAAQPCPDCVDGDVTHNVGGAVRREACWTCGGTMWVDGPAEKADFAAAPMGRCSACKGEMRVLGVPSECWGCMSDRREEGNRRMAR